MQIGAAAGMRRRLLLAGAAFSLAIAIWTMHFVGMLAARMPFPVDYLVFPTLLSFLVCVVVVGAAVYAVSSGPLTLLRLTLSACLMGGGIFAMHYIGMSALSASAYMIHDRYYVAASMAIAIAASGLALWLATGRGRRPPLILSAIALGVAVSGMHYTAMAGLTLLPYPGAAAGAPALSTDLLAIIVAIVAFCVSGIFLLILSLQAEAVAKRAERELRLAINTIPALVWSALPDGSLDFINQRWEEIGLSLDDLRGSEWINVLHPDERAGVADRWRTAVETGTPYENIERVRRADGEYRWFLSRAQPLRDELGKIVKWYGADSDIEDQKRAEDALRESEQRFRDFTEFGFRLVLGDRPGPPFHHSPCVRATTQHHRRIAQQPDRHGAMGFRSRPRGGARKVAPSHGGPRCAQAISRLHVQSRQQGRFRSLHCRERQAPI